jgi:hypothetical protein
MLVLLWLPDTVYVEYIFSIAFAYVGHDLKKKVRCISRFSHLVRKLLAVLSRLLFDFDLSWENHFASFDGTFCGRMATWHL